MRKKAGGPGADGQHAEHFARELDATLARLRSRLLDGSYRPGPLLRRALVKPDGGERLLAVPTLTDRVVQTATHNALARAFDRDFSAASFAYRPRLAVELALARVVALRLWGFGFVVDADIRRFFDEVSHERLLNDLEKRLNDRRILALIAQWLAAFGGEFGLAQGAPISPFLANLFLDPVDKAIESKSVRLVRYADDLLLLCRSAAKAGRALDRLAALLADRGLRLHETKTRLTTFDEGFDFLGYRFEGPSLFRPEALPSCPAKSSPNELSREMPAAAAAAPNCSISTDDGKG